MKKALLFDPYLDTLGGGERYFLSFALGLLRYGYEVEIAWNRESDMEAATKRFGLDLSKISLNKEAFRLCANKSSIIERFKLTKGYDLVFWVSDGSLPLLFSSNNLIHFQVPFTKLGGNSILNRLKSLLIHHFVYNSEFTRNIIERHLPKEKGFVLYPPIDTGEFVAGKKENIILSVARFDSPSHSKRQDILIRAFRELNKRVKGYKLYVVGGLKGKSSVVDPFIKLAHGLPVHFFINPEFKELKKFYTSSKIFWHAAGFGIDDHINPEKVEHFGMTTVEAMSAGCVPVVIEKGGQREIIKKGSGLLFEDIPDLVSQTIRLINDKELLSSYQKSAIKRSSLFSIKSFYQKIGSLL